MNTRRRTVPTWGLLAILLLLAAACGGDESTTSSGGDAADSEASDDSSSDDSSSDDTGSSDEGSDDDSGSTDDSAGDDSASNEDAGGDVDCDAVNDAIHAAGGTVENALSLDAPDDPQAQMEQARARMINLRDQAPDIADEIDDVIAGLDVITSVYAEVGWDTDFSEDPSAAMAFSHEAFSHVEYSNMIGALPTIAVWLGLHCG